MQIDLNSVLVYTALKERKVIRNNQHGFTKGKSCLTNLIAFYKEGVMVAKKDVHMSKHPELADKNVPNLHVMKAMQSLKSRGYVKEQFVWRHFYWYLANEGIQYFHGYLHLPEIVPATLCRSHPETGRRRPKGLEGERPARLTRGEADRNTYRRSTALLGADKKAEAGAGAATEFQFRGGFGCGRGQPLQ
ncbi:LOW QUALITY PROTEIN: 40S ribosomal protein S10-like [Dermochelys coriacea]|uniref:LOW QUALITY PROTEIN: 40S ribosomal protein S10-like n=1 Tax=Dermochelys coriacea TaxID=27794 RepID=UPI001CA87484|nr:LOW QUALITY PROTEIN: 40S ribosomal protein S10-like [Dermochelys coriacea]